jgi:hypothetical protein
LNAPLGGEGKGRGRPGRRWRGSPWGRWGGRLEVGDAPDRWDPPVGDRERE